MRGIMTEIIKKGSEKTVLYLRCYECCTEFKTDEWSIMHAPRNKDTNKPSDIWYIHASCPVCNEYLTFKPW